MSAVDVEFEALDLQGFEWADACARVASRKVDLRDTQAVRAQIVEPFKQERAFVELLRRDPAAFDALRAEAVAHVLRWWVKPTAAAHRLAQFGVAPLVWLPSLAGSIVERGPLRLISTWCGSGVRDRALDPNMVLRVAQGDDYEVLTDPVQMASALLAKV